MVRAVNTMSRDAVRQAILEAELEDSLLDRVTQLARLHGWLVYHTYDSQRSEPGFPDLTMVRGGRVVFRELKREKGRVSPHQKVWLEALATAGADAAVWRPSDWEEIERCLTSRT